MKSSGLELFLLVHHAAAWASRGLAAEFQENGPDVPKIGAGMSAFACPCGWLLGWVNRHPMPGDIYATRDPDIALCGHVIQQPLQRDRTCRMTNQAHM
jgi:hypothetical protein